MPKWTKLSHFIILYNNEKIFRKIMDFPHFKMFYLRYKSLDNNKEIKFKKIRKGKGYYNLLSDYSTWVIMIGPYLNKTIFYDQKAFNTKNQKFLWDCVNIYKFNILFRSCLKYFGTSHAIGWETRYRSLHKYNEIK